ncbi:MAG: hypothetical protein ISR47_00415 [Rhodospirillales bacterium]|nr:hypothetical protein [Rhodospirillales bacterium]
MGDFGNRNEEKPARFEFAKNRCGGGDRGCAFIPRFGLQRTAFRSAARAAERP